MLIKINNRKIVDTTKTPAIILFEPHEIEMIKGWKNNEDIIFSHPSGWTQKHSEKWMDKRKGELVALHATNQRSRSEEKAQQRTEQPDGDDAPVTCMHGVVHEEGKPECSECTRIAEAMGVDKRPFTSTNDIQGPGRDENGNQW